MKLRELILKLTRLDRFSFPIYKEEGFSVTVGWAWLPASALLFLGPLPALLFVTFFGSILLHEFGHKIACLFCNIRVRRVKLISLNFAYCSIYPPKLISEKEIRLIALAGPLMNIALAIIALPFLWPLGRNIAEDFLLIQSLFSVVQLIPFKGSDGWLIANSKKISKEWREPVVSLKYAARFAFMNTPKDL